MPSVNKYKLGAFQQDPGTSLSLDLENFAHEEWTKLTILSVRSLSTLNQKRFLEVVKGRSRKVLKLGV